MATIYEVSKLAGVSLATVSRVINNSGKVAAATRERVEDAMRELGYRPNSIAQSLAQVNARIGSFNGAAGGIPNDILDERDKLVDELSQFTNVTTLEQSNGAVNVFIGTGQALVIDANANTLAVVNNPQAADHKEIVIQQTGGLTVNVTAQMTGGSLGGLLRFRDEVVHGSFKHKKTGARPVGFSGGASGVEAEAPLLQGIYAVATLSARGLGEVDRAGPMQDGHLDVWVT